MAVPTDIFFCADSVQHTFPDGETILEKLTKLKEGKLNLRDLPLTKVVVVDGRFYALNNRILCLLRLLEIFFTSRIEVKVQFQPVPPPDFERRFTTQCRGEWVRIRDDGRIVGKSLEDTTYLKEELLS